MQRNENAEFELLKTQVVFTPDSYVKEVTVTVFQLGEESFIIFTKAVYRHLVTSWEDANASQYPKFPITDDEFSSLCFTALRSRLARVNGEHGHIRTDAEWCLPAIIAQAVNMVGLVVEGAPYGLIRPVWNHDYDSELLDESNFNRVTGAMRRVQTKLSGREMFVSRLSGDKKGNPDLMTLVPVLNSETEVITPSTSDGSQGCDSDGTYYTRTTAPTSGKYKTFHSGKPVQGSLAFVYAMMGFFPEAAKAWQSEAILPLLPPFTLHGGALAVIAGTLESRVLGGA